MKEMNIASVCVTSARILITIWPGQLGADKLPEKPQSQKTKTKVEVRHSRVQVRATYYHAVRGQCDGDPTQTADGSRIRSVTHAERHRWIALSRDLHRKFPFGTKLYVHGLGQHSGVYTVHDLMNRRFRKRVDVLVGTKSGITAEAWTDVQLELIQLPPAKQGTLPRSTSR